MKFGSSRILFTCCVPSGELAESGAVPLKRQLFSIIEDRCCLYISSFCLDRVGSDRYDTIKVATRCPGCFHQLTNNTGAY